MQEHPPSHDAIPSWPEGTKLLELLGTSLEEYNRYLSNSRLWQRVISAWERNDNFTFPFGNYRNKPISPILATMQINTSNGVVRQTDFNASFIPTLEDLWFDQVKIFHNDNLDSEIRVLDIGAGQAISLQQLAGDHRFVNRLILTATGHQKPESFPETQRLQYLQIGESGLAALPKQDIIMASHSALYYSLQWDITLPILIEKLNPGGKLIIYPVSVDPMMLALGNLDGSPAQIEGGKVAFLTTIMREYSDGNSLYKYVIDQFGIDFENNPELLLSKSLFAMRRAIPDQNFACAVDYLEENKVSLQSQINELNLNFEFDSEEMATHILRMHILEERIGNYFHDCLTRLIDLGLVDPCHIKFNGAKGSLGVILSRTSEEIT